MQDVLGVRDQEKNGVAFTSTTLNQRNYFFASVNQQLGNYGLLNFSASTADYYNDQSRITEYQLGYNNNWKRINYGLSMTRQYTSYSNTSNQPRRAETIFSINVSVPLTWQQNSTSVSFNYNQSKEVRGAMATLTGTVGENSDTSYSIYGGYDRYRNHDDGHTSSWGLQLQQNTRIGSMQASWNQGSNYRQLGLGTSGTIALHSGGVTLGPYTSETFALIHAKGAEGAKVVNGQGAMINSFGYAIQPSLSPYRYNNISLDTRDMNNDVELIGGSERVVPYSGAIPIINMATRSGKAVLINVKTIDESVPPMGTEVEDETGTIIGMVGQGGQVYARVTNNKGSLKIKWGNSISESCNIHYQLPDKSDESIIRLNQTCDGE